MNSTLAYLRSRRAWLVENIAVWGADKEAELPMVVSERIGSDVRIGFWNMSLGGQFQDIVFADLIDAKGNTLPDAIERPAIIIMPRGSRGAFIKDIAGSSGFSIARNDNDSSPVRVDILIFEMG